MSGRSTTVNISFGMALVAGKKRVPRPATGNTALRIFMKWLQRIEGHTGDENARPAQPFQRFRVGSRFYGCAAAMRHVYVKEPAHARGLRAVEDRTPWGKYRC